MTKEEALDMFKENKFKQQLINEKIKDGTVCTAYRCGPLVDLCRGPHIPSTKNIQSFKIVKNASAYWKGDAKNAPLQRVYGISFPDKKMMKKWQQTRKKAEEANHRHLGTKYQLFFFDDITPGSCFWLPHGTRIYNKLIAFMRKQYVQRGYSEVVSPNVYSMELWETSGHAAKYRENMFLFECEKVEFALKPMNCPGHCVMFKHSRKSYRDLPIRMADFGVLHRNELKGSLTGLTRVRRFQQDDAHIFCRMDQIEQEVRGVLEFLKYVYGVFDFKFELELSTRPEMRIGGDDVWDKAEGALKHVMNDFCKDNQHIKPWVENPGDGAFYGPKIDIQVLTVWDVIFNVQPFSLISIFQKDSNLSMLRRGIRMKDQLWCIELFLGLLNDLLLYCSNILLENYHYGCHHVKSVLFLYPEINLKLAPNCVNNLLTLGFYADVADGHVNFNKNS
eukprot:UN30830